MARRLPDRLAGFAGAGGRPRERTDLHSPPPRAVGGADLCPHERSRSDVPLAPYVAQQDVPARQQDDEADGPAYEPLFGSEGGAGKRRQRPPRPPATATQRALGLLTRREHSRKELTRKLVSRGVDPAEVEAAVDKLTAAGWQDDRRFAESLVRARASAGYGPLHIRAELGTHDLPPDVRADVLDSFDGDWTGIARDLATRRFARVGDPRLRGRKAADFLTRRGFPGDVVHAASRFDATGD